MRFSVLEIFFLFWMSAFLWVIVEYIYHRINRREKNQSYFNDFKEEKKLNTIQASSQE